MKTKGELSKERILHEAIKLFSKNSFKSVTIRQIAKASGVSPGLIYKYFDTQEELYYEVMQMASHELLSLLKPLATLEEFVEVYLKHMYTSEVLFEIMTYFSLDKENPDAQFPIMSDITLLLQLLEEKITGNYAKIEAQLLFSTLNGLIISYKRTPKGTSDAILLSIQKLARYYVTQLKLRVEKPNEGNGY